MPVDVSYRLRPVFLFVVAYLGSSTFFIFDGRFENWLFYSQVTVLHFLLLYLLAMALRMWEAEHKLLNLFVVMPTMVFFPYWFGLWLEGIHSDTAPINVIVLAYFLGYTAFVNVIAWGRASWAYRLGIFGFGFAALALLRLVRPAPYASLSVFFAVLLSAAYVSRFGRVPLRVYAAAALSATAALTAPDEVAVLATAAPPLAVAAHQLLSRRTEFRNKADAINYVKGYISR